MATKKNDPKKKPARKGATPAKKNKAPKAAPETPKTTPEPQPVPVGGALRDPSLALDGRRVLDCVRHVLNASPKVKDSPALAFVLLLGDRALATDDYAHNTAWLPVPFAPAATKVTKASVEALEATLAGIVKAGEKTETSVTVYWSGLSVTIVRGPEEHEAELERFEGGPDPDVLTLAAPPFDGHQAPLNLDTVRKTIGAWKGDGTVTVFVSESAKQAWFDVDEGGHTVARTVLAFRGASLNIRQPSLPGVSTTPKAPTAPTLETDPLGLTSGLGWVRIEINDSEAWAKVPPHIKVNVLPIGTVDGARGVVTWGPYPVHAALVTTTIRYLQRLGLEPREIPCDAPALFTLPQPPRAELGAGDDGVIDAEFEEAKPPFEDPAPGVVGDVLRVTVATWEAFDADATERLIAPLEMARVMWIEGTTHYTTEPVTPRVAEALVTVLRELGCEELDGGLRPGGGEVRTFALPKAGA